MGRAIVVLPAVVAIGGCTKHDTKAQEERERTIMMRRLIEAAEQDGVDAGPVRPAVPNR